MNILVIGNGFDLAHGLPTKYTDFLKFVEVINQVIEIKNNDDISNLDWRGINQQIKELIKINMGNVRNNIFSQGQVWRELLEDNFWIEYFLQCLMYQKENWIDFESEISKIIQSLDNDMFDESKRISGLSDEVYEISNDFLQHKYSQYLFTTQIKIPLTERRMETLTFQEIRDKLYYDLNRFIRALEIYLADYVEKIECNRVSPDIEKMSFDKVLSFNYTKTYTKLYDSCVCAEYDYIHGSTDIKNTIETNNMVLGIDEYLDDDGKNRDTDFIAFKKFYQRIYKETGCKYKDWITEIHSNAQIRNLNYCNKKDDGSKEYVSDYSVQHNLYIFGHSLDITDKDILRELILNDKVYTTIFYVNKDVMGKQIANLVKIIGQDELIRRTGGSDKTIEFRQQQAMVCRENRKFKTNYLHA